MLMVGKVEKWIKNEEILHFVVKIFGHVTKKKYFCAENNIFVIYKIVKFE